MEVILCSNPSEQQSRENSGEEWSGANAGKHANLVVNFVRGIGKSVGVSTGGVCLIDKPW